MARLIEATFVVIIFALISLASGQEKPACYTAYDPTTCKYFQPVEVSPGCVPGTKWNSGFFYMECFTGPSGESLQKAIGCLDERGLYWIPDAVWTDRQYQPAPRMCWRASTTSNLLFFAFFNQKPDVAKRANALSSAANFGNFMATYATGAMNAAGLANMVTAVQTVLIQEQTKRTQAAQGASVMVPR